jgi:SPX domain protein involved in polyphosphate accumulation
MRALQERLLAYMQYDEYCADRPEQMYSVRSIYFDTPRQLFYFEKIIGKKSRKKLRVRCYNSREDNRSAFLEIKRKESDLIFKDRAAVPFSQIHNLTNGAQLNLANDHPTPIQQAALDRFIYLIKRLNLQPSALVTYERMAFKGMFEPDLRLTLDLNVRSYQNPEIDDLFREEDLRTFCDPWFILEVKFYGEMPYWVRQIVRDFQLQRQSISKYCWGLDVWRQHEEIAGP